MKRQESSKLLKGLACLCVVYFAFMNVRHLWQDLPAPEGKDFRSGYLLAQAMAHGVDPYQPLPVLAERWLPGHVITDLTHPTPHPFAFGWLCLPLTKLGYARAALVWLLFEITCLAAAVWLWLRLFVPGYTWRHVAGILLLLLAWHPVMSELWYGQLTCCLLLLFLAAWTALRQGRDGWGGAFLGAAVVLKLMGWPLLLWLAWQRRWRAVVGAALVWLGAHGLAILAHGWPLVRDYYLRVGPQLGDYYRVYLTNLSLWTLGERLFGTRQVEIQLLPLWDAPGLVKVVTLLAPVLGLALLAWVVWRVKSFDTSFAFLMASGMHLNPITWSHYYLMVLPALAIVLRHLAERGWPRQRTQLTVLLLMVLSAPQSTFAWFFVPFVRGYNEAGLPIVGALPALVMLLPVAALGVLLWQMLRLEADANAPSKGAWLRHEAAWLAGGLPSKAATTSTLNHPLLERRSQ